MKFLDQAKIYIASGRGGKGCVSFPELGNEWKAGETEALEYDERLKHKISESGPRNLFLYFPNNVW